MKNGIPNFTIILPGPCQAKCKFCYWKGEEVADDYMVKLEDALKKLPPQFHRVSLTGGEPTLSPYLQKVVTLLRKVRQWDAIVLTTNGAVIDHLYDLDIDHVNISRHAENDIDNRNIFLTKYVPDLNDLANYINILNEKNIDVTINCTLQDQFKNRESLLCFLTTMHTIGASAVCFRKDQRIESIEPPKEMKWFSEPSQRWSCEACRVWYNIYLGMRVIWKSSIPEPSLHYGSVYELIFHPNGRLTVDWAGNHDYNPVKEENNNMIKITMTNGTTIECTPEEFLKIKDSLDNITMDTPNNVQANFKTTSKSQELVSKVQEVELSEKSRCSFVL